MGRRPDVVTEREYRDAEFLTRLLVGAIFVWAFASVIAAASTAGQIGLLTRIRDGGVWSEEEAESNDLRQSLLGLLQLGLHLATSVVFLVWVHRIASNASTLRRMSVTPGWAVGWYFIPIANLWKPLEAMREVWRASEPPSGGSRRTPSSGTPAVLGLWWAAWIASGVLGWVVFRTTFGASDTLPDLLRGSYATLVGDLWDLVLGLAALIMVRTVAARVEEARRAADAAPDVAVVSPSGP